MIGSRRKTISAVVSLPLIIIAILALSISAIPTAAQDLHAPLLIAAGDTSQASTILWARSPIAGDVSFSVSPDSVRDQIVAASSVRITDPMQPIKVEITGLQPGTRYAYQAIGPNGVSADGKFRTPDLPGKFAGLRFGVSGDWSQEIAPYPAIRNIPVRDLSVFVKLGDTIYVNVPSPRVNYVQPRTLAAYREKHLESLTPQYGMNTWDDVHRSTSILATIDDGDISDAFPGGAPSRLFPRYGTGGPFVNMQALYRTGIQAFLEYMPIRNTVYQQTGDPRFEGVPQLYRAQTYGSDAMLIVLDVRSFRDMALDSVLSLNRARQDAFVKASYEPGRTLLGSVQREQLKADLLRAQQAGITWKFIMTTAPIQNLGPVLAGDRFEGYAAERAEILAFIRDNRIENVVFVAGSVHGTVVNNLAYRERFDGPVIPVDAWEIITGPVAHDPPFGPDVLDIAARNRLFPRQLISAYNLLPLAARDAAFGLALDEQLLKPFGYDPVGLGSSNILAELLRGGYVAVNGYGWTEFEIDKATQALLVTVYQIAPYSRADFSRDAREVVERTPAIVTQFRVSAVG